MGCDLNTPIGFICPVCQTIHKKKAISRKMKWAIGLGVFAVVITGIAIYLYRSDILDKYMYDRSVYRYKGNGNYDPNPDTGEIKPRRYRRYVDRY